MSSAQRDLLYGGDMMKWRKFNNSLYLRLLMRLSNRDREMGIAARVRAVFEDSAEWPVFTSNDDNATFYYDPSSIISAISSNRPSLPRDAVPPSRSSV